VSIVEEVYGPGRATFDHGKGGGLITASGSGENQARTRNIEQISYRQFGKGIIAGLREQRLPISGSFELTLRCNLDCAHCYVRLPGNDKQARHDELSSAEICRMLDDAAGAGCLWLLLTGGEPLIRPDFLEIYTYAKRKGFLISLFTNGTLLTEEIADHLQKYPPYVTEITLYGATAGTHEQVTRVPGSFQQSLSAIYRLMERDVPLRLKTMVMTINRHELDDLSKLAEGLGLQFRFDPTINAPLNGSKEPLGLRLKPEEVLELELSDRKRTDSMREFIKKFHGAPNTKGIYGCGAGLENFHIDPYGQMSLCMSARWPSYDLRHGSLEEGFYNFFPQVRSQKPKSSYICGSCEIHSLCSNCPGTAYAETGDPEAVVDYYCQIARLRAQALLKTDDQCYLRRVCIEP
jgi:radical SAM protein with 4Fe4S-binding SPASM domain